MSRQDSRRRQEMTDEAAAALRHVGSSFPRESIHARSALEGEADQHRSVRLSRPEPAKPPREAKCHRDKSGRERAALSTMRRRIERAIKTDRALPDRERAQMKVRVHPFIVGYDRWDWPPAAQTRFTPNRHDLDDYLPAMALLAKLPEDLRQIVMWAALGDSFASVAWRFARKYPETPNADECRARFWIAIARCVEIDHDARRRAAETAGEGRGAA